MSSPIYTGFSSPTCIFSLPLEVIEQILVACAFSGSPESIAAFSQTCRIYSELVYGSADNHLWREIYLAAFDDPRLRLNVLKRPFTTSDALEEVAFEWRNEYQCRIRAGKMLETSVMDLPSLALNLYTLSSTATSSPPQIPEASSGSSAPVADESLNIAWMKQVFANGFPPALVRRLIAKSVSPESDVSIAFSEQIIMRPDWERSAAGRAFYKLFFLSGFRAVPRRSNGEDKGDADIGYNLRSSATKKKALEETSLSEANQRAFARTVARHRVYNLPYLSSDRCWGPFIRASSPPPPPLIDDLSLEAPVAAKTPQTDGKGKEEAFISDQPESMDAEAGPSSVKKRRKKEREQNANEDPESEEAANVSMSFIRAILNNFDFYFDQNGNGNINMDMDDEDEDEDPDYIPLDVGHSPPHVDMHTKDERDEENYASSESSETADDDSESQLDLFVPASGPLPIYPSHPHLLFPDYAFLSAARLVVAENLRERYGGGSTGDIPMWPWFTTSSAIDATREILVRMGIPLPQLNDSSRTNIEKEEEDVGDDEDAEGNRQREGGTETMQFGWESLRMGSAPGFWAGRGTKEGWTGIKDEVKEERPEMPAPWKKDESLEYIDGWDWAGAEGRWMRAVCWMDYRDLLYVTVHNLQTTYPLAARYHHEIQETCRVFPMTLRVVGYSRVRPPFALPASAESAASSECSTPSKDKGKEKAKDIEDPPYDPLVYVLPVIHVVGEFRGSDVDESVARRARGTIRMIGDRAVRWNLISSEVSTPDSDEWVMEGVQVGGIGSAMGVVGMWTGANHERGDPIGPSWAWKIE